MNAPSKKILIIGQNPGRYRKSTKTCTLYKLQEWMNECNVRYYSFTNVSIYQGSTKANLERINKECKGYDKVVALGKVASSTLNKLDIRHLPMPHPSGLNRQWNNPEFKKLSLQCLENYIKD